MSTKDFKNPHRRHKRYDQDTEKYEKSEDRNRRYYNELLLKKALKLTNSNPNESRRLYEEYLQQYPNDCLAWTLYASILITLKEIDLASSVLDKAEEMIDSYRNKSVDFQEQHTDKKNIIFGRIRIMCYRGQYRKLLDYIGENSEISKDFHLDEVKLYCKKKLGYCNTKRDGKLYLARQVIKYDINDMLNRVGYHEADYNAMEERQENVFSPNFPVQKVIDEIGKYIPSEEHFLFPGVLADCYYFKYDCCGKENNKTTNYIKVACFHNTGDIITICPVPEGKNLPYIDLNYLQQQNEPKQKRLSRTEKFYQRYGKKIES